MKNIILFFSLILILSFTEAYAQHHTTIILVRHAEKSADGGNDPSLSSEGLERAGKLNRLLEPSNIVALYSTPYKRTRETLKPLANSKKLEINEYSPFDENLLSELIDNHRNETIVISGHSNTIPVYVNQLIGKDKFEQLNENEYDKIFIVSLTEVGNGSVTTLSF